MVVGLASAVSSANLWQPELETTNHKARIDHFSLIGQVLSTGFIMALYRLLVSFSRDIHSTGTKRVP